MMRLEDGLSSDENASLAFEIHNTVVLDHF